MIRNDYRFSSCNCILVMLGCRYIQVSSFELLPTITEYHGIVEKPASSSEEERHILRDLFVSILNIQQFLNCFLMPLA